MGEGTKEKPLNREYPLKINATFDKVIKLIVKTPKPPTRRSANTPKNKL